MRMPRVQFTLRWMMTRIAVIAMGLAFLVAAARHHFGLEAVTILLLLPVVRPVVRAIVRAYSWTPPSAETERIR